MTSRPAVKFWKYRKTNWIFGFPDYFSINIRVLVKNKWKKQQKTMFMSFPFCMQYIGIFYLLCSWSQKWRHQQTQKTLYLENGWIFFDAVFCFRLVLITTIDLNNKNRGFIRHVWYPLIYLLIYKLIWYNISIDIISKNKFFLYIIW